ncbi:MAG: hypothetical protein EOP48_20625 [Sphingobacteriales bacterium]|nr:MAG: hypothetical protein EOP48_20625 [Sphingobacteriales bacterium]
MNQPNIEKKQKRGCIIASMIIVPVVLILLGIALFGPDTDEEIAKKKAEAQAAKESDRQFTAKVLSRQFVEGKLTSPSSAEFNDFKIRKENDSTYITMGSVDAQNAYGAMLRGHYQCTVVLRTDSTGVCSYINIE